MLLLNMAEKVVKALMAIITYDYQTKIDSRLHYKIWTEAIHMLSRGPETILYIDTY